jgi:hypothetical protein
MISSTIASSLSGTRLTEVQRLASSCSASVRHRSFVLIKAARNANRFAELTSLAAQRHGSAASRKTSRLREVLQVAIAADADSG